MKKGFTIIELLAVIVILGIVLLLVFPSFNSMKDQNNSKKCESYSKVLLEYAKIDFEGQSGIIDIKDIIELEKDNIDIDSSCSGTVNLDTLTVNLTCSFCK